VSITKAQQDVIAKAVRQGRHGWRDILTRITEQDLAALTVYLEEHPSWYEGPCYCAFCRSLGR
jgi:hypothetical protein